MSLSINSIIGTYDNVGAEQKIDIPNASKVVFSVDSAKIAVSINDNSHYMTYRNVDGVVEFLNDPANKMRITEIYIKHPNWDDPTYPSSDGSIRVWAVL